MDARAVGCPLGKVIAVSLCVSLSVLLPSNSNSADVRFDDTTHPGIVGSEEWEHDEVPKASWQSRLQAMETELASLRAMVQANNAVPLSSPATTKPEIKYPNARLTGVFQADLGFVSQEPLNLQLVGDAEDGADFRRARLQAVGSVAPNVAYSLEMDFGFPGRPSFMDVWLEVQELEILGNVRTGLYRQPIGLDVLTSVRELTFLERGLPIAFLPFRQIGVMAFDQAFDGLATWAVSGFRFPTDVFGGALGDDGGYGVATRLTGLPLYHAGHYLLHLGAAYSFLDPSNNLTQYRSTPEYFTSESGGGVPGGVPTQFPFFVDTGLIPTENVNLFGAELAWALGSLHGQAEWMAATVDQTNAGHVAFQGGYAQCAYLLTGEVRPYNHANAALGRITPQTNFGKGGWGAFEVAVRYSWIDLNDGAIQGGQLQDITGGLNWYLNQYTKFQLNYIHAMLDPPAFADNTADIIAMRAQVDF